MALDLSTMRTAIRTRTGNPATDNFFSDAQLNDAINEALQAVATEFDWPWLEATATISTVAGTAAYTPTAGWTRTKALTIDGYDSLILRSLQEIREIDTEIQGLPLYYCVEVEQIILRPVPDAVYSITHDYYKIEPELTADGNAPLMPEQYRYSIIEFATHLAHMRQGRTQEAQVAMLNYERWLKRMTDNRRRTRSTMKVRVRPGSLL